MMPPVYYISQGQTSHQQYQNIRKVLDCGGKFVQLRYKNAELNLLYELAYQVMDLCQSYNARLIINDSPILAQKVNAHGVHLGLTDGSVAKARMLLGDEKLIGGTANTLADVLQRIEEGCNYIGLGPYQFTTTKNKLSPILGIQGYQKIRAYITQHQLASVPIYAIGGIGIDDVRLLKQVGVYGVAVSGLLTKSPELFNQIQTIFTDDTNSR